MVHPNLGKVAQCAAQLPFCYGKHHRTLQIVMQEIFLFLFVVFVVFVSVEEKPLKKPKHIHLPLSVCFCVCMFIENSIMNFCKLHVIIACCEI